MKRRMSLLLIVSMVLTLVLPVGSFAESKHEKYLNKWMDI